MILILFIAIVLSITAIISYKLFLKDNSFKDTKEFWFMFIFPIGIILIKLRRSYLKINENTNI